MVAVTRDGTILTKNGNRNDRLGDYIAYVVVTSEQIRPYLGFTGPYHMIMEQTSGDRILALLGEQVIVGMDLDAHVSPSIIIDRLGPVVSQLSA